MRARDEWCRPKPPHNAPLVHGETHQARVTHPFHPLSGQVLEVVDRRRFEADGERLCLGVTSDHLEWIPVAWTSLGPPDPWIDIAAGRCLFRVEDLLRLVDLIARVGEEAPDAV